MALSDPKEVNFTLEKRKILRRLLLKKGITLSDDEIDILQVRLDLLAYAKAHREIVEAFQDDTDEPPPEGWSKYLSNMVDECDKWIDR